MRSFLLIVLSGIFCSGFIFAGDNNVLVTLKGSITSNTRVLYNIKVQNPYNQGRNLSINFGYGADVRWNMFMDRFYLGFSYEKIGALETISMIYPLYQNLRVPMEEGFVLSLMELSGYYIVPISSDRVSFYLGGGFGAYNGERLYSIGGYKAVTVNTNSNLGIHVLTGTDIKVFRFIALRVELKFRDPNFDVTNTFEKGSIEYQGYRITLPQNETVTRINLYGINYAAGVVFVL